MLQVLSGFSALIPFLLLPLVAAATLFSLAQHVAQYQHDPARIAEQEREREEYFMACMAAKLARRERLVRRCLEKAPWLANLGWRVVVGDARRG